MWVNVLKHITNEHRWNNGECSHGPLEISEKEWLQPDSAPMQAVREVVLSQPLLKTFHFYTHFRYAEVVS